MAALTAAIISVNWGIYVWAIGSGNALDAALGYYINPLFSMFLGAVLLKERLSGAQIAAIALAAGAVGVLTWESGRVPVAALGLTVTWGAYAYFKRSLPIGPNQGFLLEVLILTPFALGLLAVIVAQGGRAFRWPDRRGTPGFSSGTGARDGGAADPLRLRREGPQAVDHRHPAVHLAHDDLPHRCPRLRRGVRPGRAHRVSDDLGGTRDLYRVARAAGAAGAGGGMRRGPFGSTPPGARIRWRHRGRPGPAKPCDDPCCHLRHPRELRRARRGHGRCRAAGIGTVVNLGDALSGPLDPAGTADRLMAAGLPTVSGNHDRMLWDRPREAAPVGAVDAAAPRAARQLDWVRSLPPDAGGGGVLLTHGSPRGDEDNWLHDRDGRGGMRERTLAEVTERAGTIRSG
jgi:hypothetical protein